MPRGGDGTGAAAGGAGFASPGAGWAGCPGGMVRTAIAASHSSVDASVGQALESRAIRRHASDPASRFSLSPTPHRPSPSTSAEASQLPNSHGSPTPAAART